MKTLDFTKPVVLYANHGLSQVNVRFVGMDGDCGVFATEVGNYYAVTKDGAYRKGSGKQYFFNQPVIHKRVMVLYKTGWADGPKAGSLETALMLSLEAAKYTFGDRIIAHKEVEIEEP